MKRSWSKRMFSVMRLRQEREEKVLTPAQKRRKTILRIALVVFFVGFTTYIALNREQITFERLSSLGYLGAFLMAWIGSTTVLLPIPHLAFTFTMGSVLVPWWIGLCAGFGDSLGELWGYVAGYAVEDLVDRWKVYPRDRRVGAQERYAHHLLDGRCADAAVRYGGDGRRRDGYAGLAILSGDVERQDDQGYRCGLGRALWYCLVG